MKKLLLTLFMAVSMVMSLSAAEAVVKASSLNIPGTSTVDGYTFVIDKAEGSTAPALYTNTARLYADNTLKISGTKLTKIVFTLNTTGAKRYTTLTPSVGKINPAQATGDTQIVWEGDATEVTFTVGHDATLGSDGATKRGQVHFDNITITGDGGSAPDTPVTPSGVEFSKVTSITSGDSYVFMIDGKFGAAIAASSSFGRLNMTEPQVVDGKTYIKAENALVITEVAGKGYTIVDANKRFLGMDATHLTSFQLYTEANDGCYWSAAWNGETVTFTNNLTKCIICRSTGAEGTPYTNIAPAAVADGQTLPNLYKQVGASTPVEPDPVKTAEFEQASSVVSGSQYVMVIGKQYGAMIDKSATYGRFNLVNYTSNDDKIVVNEADAITITKDANGYVLKDSENRYLGMDDSHFTSFQLYTDVNNGCYWTLEMQADGTAKFTNALNTDCIICQSVGNNGTPYTNIAPAKVADNQVLPQLWVKVGSQSGIVDAAVADNDAAVEYYNLQGVRVAADALTPGLYITRQGNKTAKVIVK